MGTDQLAVFRERIGPRNPRRASTPTSTRSDDASCPPHPLSTLALAASIRLDDPRQEQERVVMLGIAIVAGREAARTLDRWLSQALAEYRGSRTAWDLEATTAELRLRLDRFDEILRDTADRLMSLIPGLVNGMAGSVSSTASRSGRRQILAEVAAVSSLLNAIELRIVSAPIPRDESRCEVPSGRLEP